MIIAVAFGLLIVFGTLFFVFTGDESPVDKEGAMTNAMEYLEDSDYITEVKHLPEQNKVVLIYDANADPNKVDVKKVARFAAIKLSNKVKNIEISIALVKNTDKKAIEEFTVFAQNGQLLRIIE